MNDREYGQLYLFENELIKVEDIFAAYYDCRCHKRGTKKALEFEVNLESNLLRLLDDINGFHYKVSPYSCFIVEKPVKKEIFAASFRDRIVHHLVISKINPVLERRLVYDVYASRADKGTHFGIERLRHFMASSTDNWKSDAWILKLDIKSFFASIDKDILYSRLSSYLKSSYDGYDVGIILYLIREIIFCDPTCDAVYQSPKSAWNGLAEAKSLFHREKSRGLPIGNLTSQIFANFYMSYMDHFIKHDLGIKMYGRYVDDFFLIHKDRECLKECLVRIKLFLRENLRLELNEKKTYLQRVSYGVKFLGIFIEPGHINMSSRTIRSWKSCIVRYNQIAFHRKLNRNEQKKLLSSTNSYLGTVKHYDTFRLRCRMLALYDKRIISCYKFHNGINKIEIRK